jgi:DNA-binding NarL/FixJ family response regulator
MRVVIADDDALLREGLALLLRNEGFDVVAAVDNADGFLTLLDDADAAVLDVRMSPTFTYEGLQAAVEARRRRPGFPVVLL